VNGRMTDNLKWWLQVQVRKYPVTLFQLGVFLLHHQSRLAATLLVGAFLVDRQFRQIGSVDRWSADIWKVIRFVKKHSHCGFARVDLSAIVSEDVIKRFHRRLMTEGQMNAEAQLRRLFHLRSIEEHLQRRVRIYAVSKRNAQEKPCPTAFTVDLGGFVFIADKPEHVVGVQRFYLLHELGHLSQFSTYTTRRARFGGSPFFVVYLWAFPQMVYPENSIWSFMIMSAFSLVIVMFRDVFWYFVRLEGAGFDEMSADQFALLNLSRKELFTVAKLYDRWPIPADHSLHPAIDERRRRILQVNLKHAFENRGRMLRLLELPQKARTEWPVWTSLALVVALVPFANAPSELVFTILAVGSLLSLNLLWIYWFHALALEKWLERVLSSDSLTPAEMVKRWPKEPRWQKRLRVFLGYEPKQFSTVSPPSSSPPI
jgi:hypothetical protein